MLCAFGGLDHFPSVEALMKNGKNKSLQAVELESGVGHQWRLWKWASFIASEVGERDQRLFPIEMRSTDCISFYVILPPSLKKMT